jgi:type II secretory ATPase GspE/PulE/Tfp pilus assembly ATPase PilB-like protein
MITQTSIQAPQQMEYEHIFSLIDKVLPFEACLYHQMVPLALEGSLVRLGVVDLDDNSSLEYARRMLAYLNCSLVTEKISSEAHRTVLSAYLQHTQKNEVAVTQPEARQTSVKPDIQDSQPETKSLEVEPAKVPATSNSQAPVKVTNTVTPIPITKQPTLQETLLAHQAKLSSLQQKEPSPILELEAEHLTSPLEMLVSLEPRQLLQELLARLLTGGIGRLFFERQPQYGRIIWSQDGIVQLILEDLALPQFTGIMEQLKILTKMPLAPSDKPQQVEIEKNYRGADILLRFRVMPGNYGEEATLQVLRGAALKFHQQQHLSHLSEDAMKLAQLLQRKVHEIQDRSRLISMDLENLPLLDSLLKDVENQLQAIINTQKQDNH